RRGHPEHGAEPELHDRQRHAQPPHRRTARPGERDGVHGLMIDALFLDCEQTEGGQTILLRAPALGTRVDVVAMHALDGVDLVRYRGLLIGLHADQRYLATRRAQLEAFLGQGGTIVMCGQVATPFLAELAAFVPMRDYRLDDLRVNL